MKTSNILLVLSLSVTLLFGFSSNLVLKAEFDKINPNDPFHGYKKEALQPFKYITLGGKAFGIARIQYGQQYEIRSSVNKELLDWNIVGDTLKVTYRRNWSFDHYNPSDPFRGRPNLYITMPELSEFTSDGVTCIISDLRLDSLKVQQKGNQLLLKDSQIANLSAMLVNHGRIVLDGSNSIGNAVVTASDSSYMSARKDVFRQFRLAADSTTIVSVPGGLLKKMIRL
jgi:hypothetical protein